MYRIRLDFKVFFAIMVFFVELCSASEYSSNILYFQDIDPASELVISFTNNADTDDVLTIRAYDENGVPLDVFFRNLESGKTEAIDAQSLPDGMSVLTVEFNGDVSFHQHITSKGRSARTTNCYNGLCITSSVQGGVGGTIGPIWGDEPHTHQAKGLTVYNRLTFRESAVNITVK